MTEKQEKKQPYSGPKILQPSAVSPETVFWLKAGNFEEGFSPDKKTVAELMALLEQHPHPVLMVLSEKYEENSPTKQYSLYAAGDTRVVWAALHTRGGVDLESIPSSATVGELYRRFQQMGLGRQFEALILELL
jgi:hypothetical protein